ncbi:MAG: glycosyltransferase family 2 protein [Chitinophagaceae bacterium]|nr:glycosyltransferase family 2 protein [Chitinophagaceae bacterium]
MNDVIQLSIIICSRNRAKELESCLPVVAKQASLFRDVEVIVVDNGSTDNTMETIQRIVSSLQYVFRYVLEPIPGLCQARNRGRAEAKRKSSRLY